ncbi:MAG TPA: serine/threonine-protein kinase [Pseudomonadota bacterium]|nr:serine/threonine-protein kinase [Pseudomonadota bacterium]
MIGTKIGQYQVLRELGKGGMGEVYEAVDDKIGRHVAIKVLLPRFSEDSEISARFFNEARAVNLIGHPGLVQVFEFGDLPTGGAFMVMEYIPGITLRDRLKQGERLAEIEALQIALQLASALSAAHTKEIVHRELKPPSRNAIPFFPELVPATEAQGKRKQAWGP